MKQSDGLIFKFSHFYIAAAALLLTACATADKQSPKNTINQDEVMSKLSLEDKAHFVIGTGMARRINETGNSNTGQ